MTGGSDDPFSRHILPLFATASEVAIVAAFVLDGGLSRIEHDLQAALRRGARVRILTGDYLDVTQVAALERLLDWQESFRAPDEDEAAALESAPAGSLETRVIEVDKLPGLTRSFHPKSWRFESAAYGIAFVGSSNLSRSALDTGIEWNLRVDRELDGAAYAQITGAFEALWATARPLDAAWIESYGQRARERPQGLPVAEVGDEALEGPPEPHGAQREALSCLRTGRTEHGWRSALVVLATGLGKTWLAAFDYRQLYEELGTRPRLLFLAHRQELLRQAAHCYRRLLRDAGVAARVGWFVQDEGDLSADLVFASVQKLARARHLARLAAERFDYVVVDEVHHAAARSYRAILSALQPRFLLGLTATPDRADAGDVLGLFDDRIAYTADIGRGVSLERLVPFHYFGLKDSLDYEHIPWRNKRFDPEELAQAVQTEARMETLWRAWHDHRGTRTLVFCCSIAHAVFVRRWLGERGVRVAAVFSAPGTDDRDQAIRALTDGELDAVCSVDVFNEGVDVPSVDRVVMLRPTESSVIFLQQLGRGLRAAPGKSSVTVIDFVGNHRMFLERVRTLLSLSERAVPLGSLLDAEATGALELPSGCSVELELEAKEVLSRLFRVSGTDEVERAYRELRLARGERPTAGELQGMGYRPARLRPRYAGWFDFVRAEGDLNEEESRALDSARAFLNQLETFDLRQPLPLVAVQAVVETGSLYAMSLLDNARRSQRIVQRSSELIAELPEDQRSRSENGDDPRWVAFWRDHALTAWTESKQGQRAWFRLDGDRLVPELALSERAAEVVSALVLELLDYRMAEFRARKRQGEVTAESFVCPVLWNKRDPILKLPRQRDRLPQREAEVLVDNAIWLFRFAAQFCNVARPVGTQRNQLPDLLRRWFGPNAGRPGTAFQVRFRAGPDGLWAEPVRAVTTLETRRGVAYYPDLRAAAGHVAKASLEPTELTSERVSLPIASARNDVFAVRVCGTSMDGGSTPLRDGDWVVFSFARDASASALENRVVLVQVTDATLGADFQIKRLKRRDSGWVLASDNPSGPTFEATEAMTPIARLEQSFRPEDLACPRGTVLAEDELAAAFGLAPRSGRHEGHLFVFIDRADLLTEPDRIRYVDAPNPGETAFALAQRDRGDYIFLGVARPLDDEQCWAVPDVDYETWRNGARGARPRDACPPARRGAPRRS